MVRPGTPRTSCSNAKIGGALLVLAAVGPLGGIGRAHSVIAAQGREIAFEIDAQPLAAALDAYSLATGIQLFYASDLTHGLRSAPVIGRYSSQEAILILLGGTGLRPRITANNAITLDRIRAASAIIGTRPGERGSEAEPIRSRDGAAILRLGTLRVEANKPRPAVRRYRFYAAAVRMQIGRALRRNKRLRDSEYRAQLSIWLSANGRVVRSAMHGSSGDAAIDGMVRATLDTVVVRPDPPDGMPQPIHIDVTAIGT